MHRIRTSASPLPSKSIALLAGLLLLCAVAAASTFTSTIAGLNLIAALLLTAATASLFRLALPLAQRIKDR